MQKKMLIKILTLCVTLTASNAVPYIVGGYQTDIADHPWQGSYRNFGRHVCGCALIADYWAVTAAHCGGGILGFSVAFGNSDRSKGTTWKVRQVKTHPEYMKGDGSYPNDIAVLRFWSKVKGKNIKIIPMARKRLMGGEAAVISGWGKVCKTCEMSKTLKAAAVTVLSDEQGRRMWGSRTYNKENHVCVYNPATRSDGACNGDSGGPVVSGGVLHGVASFCEINCKTHLACAYTRITKYFEWVCDRAHRSPIGC